MLLENKGHRFIVAAQENIKGVDIPVGFASDGASVPRLLWWLYDPFQPKYLNAFILHDYLYTIGGNAQDRKHADKLMKEVLKELGAKKIMVEIFYFAVRVFGRKHFGK